MKPGPKPYIHRRTHCQFGHSMDDAIVTVEHRTTHRRCRTCSKNRKKYWDADNPEKVEKQRKSYAPIRLERSWRFRMWEVARLSQEDKDILKSVMLRRPHITNSVELKRPVFIFELNGKKHTEYLDFNEPLPTWDEEAKATKSS